MTYRILWDPSATNSAVRFLKDDPDGLRQLFTAVDWPADEPRPAGSVAYDSPDLRRLRAGRYRVLYEITESTVTIVVLQVGRRE